MKIISSTQMGELDRLTVEQAGISWGTLMETAGVRVTEEILAHSDCSTFVVLCGQGNNGGDGAVIARHLWLRGASLVDVFLFGSLEQMKGDARANLEIIRQLAATQSERTEGVLTFNEVNNEFDASIPIYHDCIVDALFGSGLNRPPEGIYAVAIEAINHERRVSPETLVVAVDIPSGLSADTGKAQEPFVRADLTVSLTAPKMGNVLPPASDANGILKVVPIGTPPELIDQCESRLFLVDQNDVAGWLSRSRRSESAHKGSVGDVLIVAGSPGKTGAAALTSEAVLRAGAGLVTVATSRSAQQLLVSQAPREVMTETVAETESGAIGEEALAALLELAKNRTVVAVGPGLSSDDEGLRRLVKSFVEKRACPMVIDADGLNALAPWPEGLKGSAELPIVITPHPGEMARLTGMTTSEIADDRVSIVRDFAMKNGVIAVLKGNRSLIASPAGDVYISSTGNAGMATAGSGDVLTGMVAGLIAQRPSETFAATVAAVNLHGLAGDLAAERIGMRSVVASSLIEYLADAILAVGGREECGREAQPHGK
jgi:ADP-dependent NAD(P)H-hydrate dehydratase / NAD(P)H-hydrate epimerase